MQSRDRRYMWVGLALAVAGLGVALVAWVGLDRANLYLGVPAAVAGFLGLALSAYAVLAQPPGPGVRQVQQDSAVGGNSLMVGHAGRASEAAADATAQAPGVSQEIKSTRISGDSTMIGQVDADWAPGEDT